MMYIYSILCVCVYIYTHTYNICILIHGLGASVFQFATEQCQVLYEILKIVTVFSLCVCVFA